MTLDEAILHAREVAERNRRAMSFEPEDNIDDDIKVNCLNCATQHEQLAEWLEELKFLRQWKSDIMDEFCKYDCNSVEEAMHNGYNKAIDDFVKFAIDMPTVETEDGEVRPMWLEEMAEQLKVGKTK